MARRQYIYFGAAVGIWTATYIILYLISPAVPSFDTRSILIRGRYILPLISGLLLLFTTLFVVGTSPGIRLKFEATIALIFVAVVVDNYSSNLDSYGYIWSFLVSDLSIIAIGILMGKLLSSFVQQKSWIVPIALVAMVADLWSVSYGPSFFISSQPPQVMRHFLLFYPLLGASTMEATMLPYWLRPFIGMSDVIFLSLYLELARKFDLHVIPSRIAMGAAMLVPITLASLAERGIPALPFMSAIFVFVNFRYLEFKKKELLQSAIFLVVLGLILYLLYNNPATREFMSLER